MLRYFAGYVSFMVKYYFVKQYAVQRFVILNGQQNRSYTIFAKTAFSASPFKGRCPPFGGLKINY